MITTHMTVMSHIQIERHNRKRHNPNHKLTSMLPSKKFFKEHVLKAFNNLIEKEVFAFTVSNPGQEYVSIYWMNTFQIKTF